MVAPITLSPTAFATGIDSPVSIDSSTWDPPSAPTPSTGILSGRISTDVALQHVGRRNVTSHRCAPRSPWRRQVHQRADRLGRPGAGTHLEPVPEQDEHQQYGDRLTQLRAPKTKVAPTMNKYPVPTPSTTSTAMLNAHRCAARRRGDENRPRRVDHIRRWRAGTPRIERHAERRTELKKSIPIGAYRKIGTVNAEADPKRYIMSRAMLRARPCRRRAPSRGVRAIASMPAMLRHLPEQHARARAVFVRRARPCGAADMAGVSIRLRSGSRSPRWPCE